MTALAAPARYCIGQTPLVSFVFCVFERAEITKGCQSIVAISHNSLPVIDFLTAPNCSKVNELFCSAALEEDVGLRLLCRAAQ
jgi:hypothetical protein